MTIRKTLKVMTLLGLGLSALGGLGYGYLAKNIEAENTPPAKYEKLTPLGIKRWGLQRKVIALSQEFMDNCNGLNQKLTEEHNYSGRYIPLEIEHKIYDHYDPEFSRIVKQRAALIKEAECGSEMEWKCVTEDNMGNEGRRVQSMGPGAYSRPNKRAMWSNKVGLISGPGYSGYTFMFPNYEDGESSEFIVCPGK